MVCQRASHLLDVLQRLNDSDVVQVHASCCVPVLDSGAVLRHCQALQELLQVVVVVVDDAVYKKGKKNKQMKKYFEWWKENKIPY